MRSVQRIPFLCSKKNLIQENKAEEDDEDQCVMFGSSTANFSAVPAAKHQWNRPLSSVQPPRAGMMVFGVLRANGTMELANTQPTLHVDDKILFAELAD